MLCDAAWCSVAVCHCQADDQYQVGSTTPLLAAAGHQLSAAAVDETAQQGSEAAFHCVISATPLPSRFARAVIQTLTGSASLLNPSHGWTQNK